jgi:hypothetical protein
VEGKFIILLPGHSYNYKLADVEFLTYVSWHTDIDKMIGWHGVRPMNKNKQYKFSAVCNRITQSKIWVTTKLLETAAKDSLILHNPTQLQDKNIHRWQPCHNATLDALTEIYKRKYRNVSLSDDFDIDAKNCQRHNSLPWQPLYTKTALHFTNSSFHYSHVHHDKSYIYPGPDIDEKILKCLVAGVPFVACGQFEIYKTLRSLGLEFEYGFDLSWDDDPGNLTRFEKICQLIDTLACLSRDDLVDLTWESCVFNRSWILEGGFSEQCDRLQHVAISRLHDILEH